MNGSLRYWKDVLKVLVPVGFPVPIFTTLGSFWSFACEVVYCILPGCLCLSPPPTLELGRQRFVCFSHSEKQEREVLGRNNSLFKGTKAQTF